MYLFDTNILSEIRKINDPKTRRSLRRGLIPLIWTAVTSASSPCWKSNRAFCAYNIAATKHNFCAWKIG